MHEELHKSLSIQNSLSQYRPGESQRSRNVPDVLFVDEDGNPIEAGEENLIFVDESGREMTEEKAIQLIESGKYIDSRVLYDDELGPVVNRSNSMSYAAASSNSFTNNSNAFLQKSNSQLPQKSNSLTHAQIQAVQAAQIAQQINLLNTQSSQSNANTNASFNKPMDAASQQEKMFAQAHAKAREQAEELAQIEADANSHYSSSQAAMETYQELAKTKSDRRLPIRPPAKKTESFSEETYELDKIIKEQECKIQKQSNSSSYAKQLDMRTPSSIGQQQQQQLPDKSSSFHQKQKKQEEAIMKQQQSQQKRREEKEREYLKKQLLEKQQELMEQHLLEKRQQELVAEQQAVVAEQERRAKRERKERRALEKRKKEEDRLRLEQEARERKERERMERAQRKEEERRQRQRQREEDEYERQRQREVESKRQMEREEEYRRQMAASQQYGTAMSGISSISKANGAGDRYSQASMGGKKSQQSFYSGNHSNNSNNENNSSYSTNTSLTRKQQRKSIESTYGKDYTVSQIRQVGYLSGKDIIRDMSQVRMDDFQHYYDEADRAQSQLEFEPHHLDSQQVQPAQFVDPFTADMFRDEMVDIDFGAIDAFTEALNQQILAEKNGVEPPKNLQFPPHVIASNHASFLENQLFLADTNTEENSGVSVQFITPSLKNKPAPGSSSTNLKNISNNSSNANESMLEKLAKAEYSRNQSFGSVVDVQKPNGKNVNNTSYNSFMQNLSRNMSHQSLVR